MSEGVLSAIALLLIGGELVTAIRMIHDKIKERREAGKRIDDVIHQREETSEANADRIARLERHLELVAMNRDALDRETLRNENRMVMAQARYAAHVLDINRRAYYAETGVNR